MSDKFNPYQAQIDTYQQELKDNQALLEDPDFADGAMKALAEDEIKRLKKELQALESAAATMEGHDDQAEADPSAIAKSANAIIEIRGGAGGDEAKLWAGELMRMYTRFCQEKGLTIELIDDLVFKIKGKLELPLYQLNAEDETAKPNLTEETELVSAFNLLRYESGVHRVQRVPVTESQGRIHTSTASVAVLPEIHARAIEIRDEDLDLQFMRASGAGGQSVNKTSSAVRLTHKPSGIVVVSRSERKQLQNRQIAMELLRAKLWELEEEKREKMLGAARKNIGRNMRAEKIKTYNFPQSRVTDHRVKLSWYNLPEILSGDLTESLAQFRAYLNQEETE